MEAPKELVDAVKKGDVTKVREITKGNPGLASATAGGISLVLLALYYGKKEAASALIAAGAVLDVWAAASLGRSDRVKELVAKDSGLANAQGADGLTAMALAAYFGHRDIAEFLIRKGADVDAHSADDRKFNALTGAVEARHADIVELLVRHGANVNHVYEEEFTPLLNAVLGGDAIIARFLLEAGADPNLGSYKGKKALAVAEEGGKRELVVLLRKHGGTAERPAA